MVSESTATHAGLADPDGVGFDIAHALAPVQATALDGQLVRLGTLWEDGHAVLVFLRHFG